MLNFIGKRFLKPSGFFFATVSLWLAASAASAATNHPPTISGTPPTSVAVGAKYHFRPNAYDSDGNTLTFSIVNKPTWATFSTTNGAINGYPKSGNVGISYGSSAGSCRPRKSRGCGGRRGRPKRTSWPAS